MFAWGSVEIHPDPVLFGFSEAQGSTGHQGGEGRKTQDPIDSLYRKEKMFCVSSRSNAKSKISLLPITNLSEVGCAAAGLKKRSKWEGQAAPSYESNDSSSSWAGITIFENLE